VIDIKNSVYVNRRFNHRPMHNKLLRSIWLEVTPKCSLNCIHCYADSSPSQPLEMGLTHCDWQEILADARSLGCHNVQFIGGEPTLYPQLGDLIRSAHDLGYRGIEVLTNGVAVNELLFDAFLKYNVSLAISVYSCNPEIHDTITGVRGSYAKTLQTIRKSLKAGLTIRASVISMEANSSTTAVTKQYLSSLGVNVVRVGRVRLIGRASLIEADKASYLNELCGRCGEAQVCVSANGTIFPCIMAKNSPIGHVKAGLNDAIQGKELLQFRKNLTASRTVCNSGSLSTYSVDRCQPKPFESSLESRSCAPDNDCHPLTCEPDSNSRTCAPDNDCHPLTCEPVSNSRTCAPDNDCHPSTCEPDSNSRPCAPDNDCHPLTYEPDSNSRTCAPDNDCHPLTCEPDSNSKNCAPDNDAIRNL